MGCTQMRRIFEKPGLTVDMFTGKVTQLEGPGKWVDRACGAPIFSEDEKKAGKCRSCLSGWTGPENMPVPADSTIVP